MSIRQLSVFLNDEAGRLAEATRVLGHTGVNLIAFSVAETVDFGIVRFIVDDNKKAVEALRSSHFTVVETPVVVARVPDKPGMLANTLQAFADAGLNVDYSYAIVHCVIAFGVENVGMAEDALKGRGVEVLEPCDLRVTASK